MGRKPFAKVFFARQIINNVNHSGRKTGNYTHYPSFLIIVVIFFQAVCIISKLMLLFFCFCFCFLFGFPFSMPSIRYSL